MTDKIHPQKLALSLIRAARHEDILGLLRLQRHAKRTGSLELLNNALVRIAVAVLGELFDDDPGQIDAFLSTWLDATKEDSNA